MQSILRQSFQEESIFLPPAIILELGSVAASLAPPPMIPPLSPTPPPPPPSLPSSSAASRSTALAGPSSTQSPRSDAVSALLSLSGPTKGSSEQKRSSAGLPNVILIYLIFVAFRREGYVKF